MRSLFHWIRNHERHLSAAAMVIGFIFDNIFFSRIDLPITHVVFLSYLAIAAFSIIVVHRLEEYTPEGSPRSKWRSIFPILTQFAFGGLWSGFLIFYAQSASIIASWPFLLILAGIFIGNEVFKKYHDRLVFNAVLYFFALYSYAIFAVPVFTHEIGTKTFLISGALAVAVFAVLMIMLRSVGRFRFLKSIWPIRFWAGSILLIINLFYFTNVLPPLPLALSNGGIYHSIISRGGVFEGVTEPSTWATRLGLPATMHIQKGSSVTAFSAVFAPVALTTKVTHEWQWFNPRSEKWVTESLVVFPITGGRDGGYRGYTLKEKPQEGKWRVNIETTDGRLIGRISFEIIFVSTLPPTLTKILE